METLRYRSSLGMQVLGGDCETLAYAAWPQYEEALLEDNTFNLPVQVCALGLHILKACTYEVF